MAPKTECSISYKTNIIVATRHALLLPPLPHFLKKQTIFSNFVYTNHQYTNYESPIYHFEHLLHFCTRILSTSPIFGAPPPSMARLRTSEKRTISHPILATQPACVLPTHALRYPPPRPCHHSWAISILFHLHP